jgi:Protein of unknown function (DUF3592)
VTFPDEEDPGAESLEERCERLESIMDNDGDEPEDAQQDCGDGQDGCGCSLPFNLAFLLVGTIIFLMYTASPVSRWIAADSWPEAECEIFHPDYGLEYRYTWEGEQYVSRRCDFSLDHTHRGQTEYDEYAEGQTARCFVNPDDPAEAILSKSFSSAYLRGLIGLPFAIFGLAMILRSLVPILSRIGRWGTGENLPR